MANLPTPVSPEQAAVQVSQWLEQVEERMTASVTREWLEGTLREYLLRDLIDRMKVIEAADKGDEIADAALGYVFHSMMDNHVTPHPSLIAYEAARSLAWPGQERQGPKSVRQLGARHWHRLPGVQNHHGIRGQADAQPRTAAAQRAVSVFPRL